MALSWSWGLTEGRRRTRTRGSTSCPRRWARQPVPRGFASTGSREAGASISSAAMSPVPMSPVERLQGSVRGGRGPASRRRTRASHSSSIRGWSRVASPSTRIGGRSRRARPRPPSGRRPSSSRRQHRPSPTQYQSPYQSPWARHHHPQLTAVSPPVVAADADAGAVTGAWRHPSPSQRRGRRPSRAPYPLQCWNRGRAGNSWSRARSRSLSRNLGLSSPPPARLGGKASGPPSSTYPRSCWSPSRRGSPGTGFSLAPRLHPPLRPLPR
jgi:hypothetical protein